MNSFSFEWRDSHFWGEKHLTIQKPDTLMHQSSTINSFDWLCSVWFSKSSFHFGQFGKTQTETVSKLSYLLTLMLEFSCIVFGPTLIYSHPFAVLTRCSVLCSDVVIVFPSRSSVYLERPLFWKSRCWVALNSSGYYLKLWKLSWDHGIFICARFVQEFDFALQSQANILMFGLTDQPIKGQWMMIEKALDLVFRALRCSWQETVLYLHCFVHWLSIILRIQFKQVDT